MRIRSVSAVLASAAVMLVPWGGGEVAGAQSGGTAAEAPADPGPGPGQPPALPGAPRRVDVEMTDYAFTPEALQVRLGETVTFVFTNTGQVVHDAFIGDKAAQDHHEQEMREAGADHNHDGHDAAVTVHPGETAAIRHQFDKLGTLEIGCHQPGHYALGMTMIIEVTPV